MNRNKYIKGSQTPKATLWKKVANDLYILDYGSFIMEIHTTFIEPSLIKDGDSRIVQGIWLKIKKPSVAKTLWIVDHYSEDIEMAKREAEKWADTFVSGIK